MTLIVRLILLLTLITACSSKTNIHLYGKYLTVEQKKQVITALDADQFIVTVTSLAFPESINDNAIVYAPSMNSQKQLTLLMNQLNGLGYTISNASLIMSNNHSFTANNVGLFLVPEGTNVDHQTLSSYNFAFPTINEYGAIDCPHATTLYLKSSNEFSLEINQWNKQQQDYVERYIDGTWQLKEGIYLSLTNNEWPQSLVFEKQNYSRNEINGSSKGVKFVPLKSFHQSHVLAEVNCKYSISIAVE